jgi:hypothetical protein
MVFFDSKIRFELPSSYLHLFNTWEGFLHHRHERALADRRLQDPRYWPLPGEIGGDLEAPLDPVRELNSHDLYMLALQAASLRLSESAVRSNGLGQTEAEPLEDPRPLPP